MAIRYPDSRGQAICVFRFRKWRERYGLSLHFNGEGFSDMRFLVHAVHASDFQRWPTRYIVPNRACSDMVQIWRVLLPSRRLPEPIDRNGAGGRMSRETNQGVLNEVASAAV
jgi:hypothetical protein